MVAVPDDPRTLAGLDETVEELAAAGVRLRIDPVLEPIGFGFAGSLGRYLQVRERYPDAEMMMGIGNLTELTDADSAAVNVVLLGFCEELGIRSVLTTQVINWARSSVRECDLARRLVYHSMRHRVLPKHLEPRLVMLRDPAVTQPSADGIGATGERDQGRQLPRLCRRRRSACGQPIAALARCRPVRPVRTIAAKRARRCAAQKSRCRPTRFILGYEMCKAATAMTLGKQYQQDEAARLGLSHARGSAALSCAPRPDATEAP